MIRAPLRLPAVFTWTVICAAAAADTASCGSRTEPDPACSTADCGAELPDSGAPDAPEPDAPFV
jgi:hypothetical protein